MHDEAEVLEHAISDRLLEAIDARLGRPVRDPHGDAIPAADGTLASEPAVLLGEAPPGHSGAVIRISDRDPAVLRLLHELGIGPGTLLTVTDVSSQTVTVEAQGAARRLPAEAALAIWVAA